MAPDRGVIRPGWIGIAAVLLAALVPANRAGADPVGNAQPARRLEHVVLQLKWLHQFQFAGYYAAKDQGYYRAAGLAVDLREAVPGHDPAEEVLAGRADFGVGTSDLILLRAKGKPVVLLADIYQHSPLVLLVRRQPGVDDLQALYDKSIMIEPLSAELFAYFKDEGIDPARLHIREHSFDVRDLIEGRVAAMSAYATDEPFLLQQAKVDFLTFTPRSGGIDFYGDNLFTTAEEIRRYPERVKAFRQASLKGWEYAMTHQAEIVDLILRSYSRRKSREHLLFEARQTDQLMHPELIEVGHVNPGRWRHIADTYAEFGMLPRAFSLDGFFYDPDPKPNLAWVYGALAALGAVALGLLGWALPIVRLNRRLRHEISERRKTEDLLRSARDAAEAADRAKGRYLAMLTHEVRTPLAGIMGLSDLLGMSPLNAVQREQVVLIETCAKNLLRLSNDVLDYSKIEAGAVKIELLPVVLAPFVRAQCDLFRAAAAAKGLILECALAPDVPEIIATDPTRLGQILSNLLSNAVKFTSAGRIDLKVEAEPAGTGRVLFQVSDTGVGIPSEHLSQLFQAYAQADNSVTRRFGGTGLGLTISRRLAELLGGGIAVRSIPDRGTTFTVAIPAGDRDNSGNPR